MGEWKEYKLGDVVDVINGYAFKSSNFIDSPETDALPVIKIKNVANGDVHLNDVQYHAYDSSLKKFVIEKGDILIALTGNHPEVMTQVVGEVSLYKLNEKALLNQRVAKIQAKEGLSENYLYYFLKDDATHDVIASNSGGSANQANISKTDIENLKLLLPSYIEQTSIASVLSCLDDKIDLLQRQNKTLEQLAETLFRQWFMEEADESWEETTLYDSIELIGGGTPKTSESEYWDGSIKWLSGGDIASNHKSFVMTTEKTITEKGLRNSSARLLPKYTTVISARGTVGKYCMLSSPMAFSQSNYGIKPKYEDCFFFTYLLVANSVNELQSASYGSVFDTITTNTFKGHKILLPTKSSIEQFEKIVKPYFQKIKANQTQIRTLTQQRDMLLPKLMSGEVRVQMN